MEKASKLSSLIPICAWCKKIRQDNGVWKQLEDYLTKNYQINFSHGICPECTEKLSLKFKI